MFGRSILARNSTKLQGFTTAISTNIGGTVQFKIDNLTGNANYQVQIYRLGYYGGDGARLVTTLQHTTSVVQPAPITNAATGEVDAGNWSVTNSWSIPSDAVSGVYVANVVQGNQVFQFRLSSRTPTRQATLYFKQPTRLGRHIMVGVGPICMAVMGPRPPQFRV